MQRGEIQYVSKWVKANMEEWIKRAKDLNVKYNKLSEEFNMLKSQNSILFETLQSVNRANNKPEPEEEFVPVMTGIPERGAVLDSGVTFDELEAMVQVMKGYPVTQNTKNQAVNTIQKTHGTDFYNQLLDRISGAKQQVEVALNSEKQTDSVKSDDNLENFDISKYV
jgi:tellurite resistance protein